VSAAVNLLSALNRGTRKAALGKNHHWIGFGMGMYVRSRRLCGSNKATLVWVAGYQGMPGNKDADKLAKEGTNKFPCDQTTGIRFVVCKEVSRESSESGAPGKVVGPETVPPVQDTVE